MKSFLMLVNFELNRFFKIYVALFIVVFFFQLVGTIISAQSYMKMAQDAVIKGGMSQLEFVQTYSTFSLEDVVYSLLFLGSIGIAVTALMFHVFFIWYRDWFARNTFIYRLLMLPTSRMNVFFAKLTTIMLTVLGLVAYQIILLIFLGKVMKWIVPNVFRVDLYVVD